VALDLGVPVPTIAAAIDARVISSMKDQRVAAAQKVKGPKARRSRADRRKLIAAVHDALFASKICSYAQGMSLIRAGSDEYRWNVSLQEMARIWKGGCIIRARILDTIMRAYERQPGLANLLLDEEFKTRVQEAQGGWRQTVAAAQAQGIAAPAMSASLAYFDSYRTANLPQNLTQAQRDFFGAHLYERADKPDRGFIHTDWAQLVSDVQRRGQA
jgi:6-phosphogluconate dehydrogenase